MNEPHRSFPIHELDYDLPAELIAQAPPTRRQDARLLVLDRRTGTLSDRKIVDFPDLLRPGDLLVLNDTKVVPAKIRARRKSGGVVDGLFLEVQSTGRWRVLLEGSKRLRVGEILALGPPSGPTFTMELAAYHDLGEWDVQVSPDQTAEEILHLVGTTPLPPYIRRGVERIDDLTDRARYQTVYAERPGAVAAPTAGLHLTPELLDRIRTVGVDVSLVTLHVGLGTFKPIVVDDLSRHVMHAERYELPPATAEAVRACRARKGRVVAVGTTTVRVLESCAQEGDCRTVRPGVGSTSLLIYPPQEFCVVDALLTNFHLPKSTLLALVMAFAGVERTRRAYAHAIEQRYRFFSFGDAMLII